jgi:3-hydroxyisobutyrate dehydrogenase
MQGSKHGVTPKAAVQDADIVFCCVGNDDDLRSVVLGNDGALAGMKKGAIYGRPHHCIGQCGA